jgi:hypothetical protein
MFFGIRVAQSVVFGVVFCKSLFVFFLLDIVFSDIFLFTGSDYPPLVYSMFSCIHLC